MSAWTESKITRDLSERDSIEPPEGLLEKLKADIPPDLGSRLPAVVHHEAEVVPMRSRQRWLLAASLILMVTGGLFAAAVVMRQTRSAEQAVAEEERPGQSDAARSPAPAVPAPRREQLPAGEPQADEAEPPAAAAAKPQSAPAPASRLSLDEEKKLIDLGYVAGKEARNEGARKGEARKEEAQDLDAHDLQVVDQRRRDVARQKVGALEPAISTALAPPPPAAQPAEVPEFTSQIEVEVEGGVVSGVEGGIEGGVVGGAPGGIVSGVVGGTPGPVPPGYSVDGVIITDQAALGGAPVYYDFDLFEEMAPQRAGADNKTDAPQPQEPQEVTFNAVPAHPFVETAKDRLSTFGLDVDTASYTVARRYLRDGHLPPRGAIRVEEFLNYFSYGDPPPAQGDFALRAEGAGSIFTQEPRTYLVRFNLRAREVKAEHRKPAVLIFVVDVSGSMGDENRLGLVKQSLGLLLDQLRKDDKVGLVVYGTDARVLLEPTSDREMIRAAVDNLIPEGSTNAEAGITLGYEVAGRNFRPGAINRILLCSDGLANQGATAAEPILARVQRETKRGIELTTLGVGMGGYNDALMEQLADKGNGRYAHLDDLDEARKVLVEELTGTLQTIAEDAKVQVEFFPAAVTRWRLIGYENRDIPDEKFRDNTVDAGEIGAGHSVTALYEVQLAPNADRSGKIASLHLRYKVPVTGVLQETIHDLRASQLVADWKDASPGFRLASLVVEFAETLRGTSHASDFRKILRRAQRVVGEMADQPRAADVADFARLVAEAARLKEAAEKK